MKKNFLILCALFLSACGDDSQITKAGSKVGEFTMVEDAKIFNSMDECIQEIKKAEQNYKLTIQHDQHISERMHVVGGMDPDGFEFMNTCSASGNSYLLRITKK